jgi:hypothetical protein
MQGGKMKRHFSNRGEALAEVTAARSAVDRRASVRAAFMTQADRRAKSPQWFSRREELPSSPKRRKTRLNEDVSVLL